MSTSIFLVAGESFFQSLLFVTGSLIAVIYAWNLTHRFRSRLAPWRQELVAGLFFGLLTVFTMSNTVWLAANVSIDGRVILVTVTCLAYGWRAGLIPVFLACATRYKLAAETPEDAGLVAGLACILVGYATGVWGAHLLSGRLSGRRWEIYGLVSAVTLGGVSLAYGLLDMPRDSIL